MEVPAVVTFAAVWAMVSTGFVPIVLLIVWMIHYLHRSMVFPFRLKAEGK